MAHRLRDYKWRIQRGTAKKREKERERGRGEDVHGKSFIPLEGINRSVRVSRSLGKLSTPNQRFWFIVNSIKRQYFRECGWLMLCSICIMDVHRFGVFSLKGKVLSWSKGAFDFDDGQTLDNILSKLESIRMKLDDDRSVFAAHNEQTRVLTIKIKWRKWWRRRRSLWKYQELSSTWDPLNSKSDPVAHSKFHDYSLSTWNFHINRTAAINIKINTQQK